MVYFRERHDVRNGIKVVPNADHRSSFLRNTITKGVLLSAYSSKKEPERAPVKGAVHQAFKLTLLILLLRAVKLVKQFH